MFCESLVFTIIISEIVHRKSNVVENNKSNSSLNFMNFQVIRLLINPGLHVRRKHKHKHKPKHEDVYTCDKHKHNVTYASAEANKFGGQ